MVVRGIFAVGLALLAALPAAAQDGGLTRFGADAYAGGRSVEITEDGVADLFAAGERVRVEAGLSGTAHLLGRRVLVSGETAGLYAWGMEVEATGAITGDATLGGYDVTVGAVGGDLRAMGAGVTVTGPVGGYALIAGDEVRIDGAITGDLSVSANELEFGPEARVGGTLYLYEEAGEAIEVPASVAPAERIQRQSVERFDHDHPEWQPPSTGSLVGRFIAGVLVITVIAAALAAILPGKLADLRHTLLDQPMRSLWIGVLTQSALIGMTVIAAITLIGILTIPAFLIVAALLWFLGYVIGVYALGVSILNRVGREMPDSFGDRALAAGVGALAAAVIALIPFVGWIFALALALAGVGALIVAWANPRFFGYP